MEALGNGSTFDKIVVFEGDELPKAMNSEEKNYEHFEEQLKIYDDMAKYIKEETGNE